MDVYAAYLISIQDNRNYNWEPIKNKKVVTVSTLTTVHLWMNASVVADI